MTRTADVVVCQPCWAEHNSLREPSRVDWPQFERCGLCGSVTLSGIRVHAEWDEER